MQPHGWMKRNTWLGAVRTLAKSRKKGLGLGSQLHRRERLGDSEVERSGGKGRWERREEGRWKGR